jgi:hypothetical protein
MNISKHGGVYLATVAIFAIVLLANVNAAPREVAKDSCDTVTKSGDGWQVRRSQRRLFFRTVLMSLGFIQWFCCGDCNFYPSKRLNRRDVVGNVSLALMGGGSTSTVGLRTGFLGKFPTTFLTARFDFSPFSRYGQFIFGMFNLFTSFLFWFPSQEALTDFGRFRLVLVCASFVVDVE